ncbi:MAG: hypothetical protein K2P52_06025 [Campylobacterales bacterium]|nr:hypothetical protein [Campylobacterales bacterium]
MQNLKIKQLTLYSFGKNIEMYVDELKNKKVDKLILKTSFKNDCVVLRIEEYERLKNLYDKVNQCQQN